MREMCSLICVIRVFKLHLRHHGDHNLINCHICVLVYTYMYTSSSDISQQGQWYTYGTTVTDIYIYTVNMCKSQQSSNVSVYMYVFIKSEVSTPFASAKSLLAMVFFS